MAPHKDEMHPRRARGAQLCARALSRFARAALLLASLAAADPQVHAQDQSLSSIIYSKVRDFTIPFVMEPDAGRLQEVQLYVSEDQGQSWQGAGKAGPEQRGFSFRAAHDGLYWFTVRTIDMQGHAKPPNVQGTRPQLRVVIDTKVPFVTIRPKATREGLVAVEWDIREENFDPVNFLLEFRPAGGRDWTPLIVEPALSGERAWNPGTYGAVEVRVRVRDLAKNDGEAKLTVTPGSNDFRPSSNAYDPDGRREQTGPAPGTRYVNSKRISLNYDIKEAGPSGISSVELWATNDARTWEKFSEDPKHESPFVFEVAREGLYGFTLLPRSGVGLADRPPRTGDQPQVWVQVDLTKPMVFWVIADVGRGQDSGKLTITWKATDNYFGREPITLSYAEKIEGPWTTIAANLPNDGHYVWAMPPTGIPYKFFVRAEAVDKAGNVGAHETEQHVIVDLAQPKSVILDVAPATKSAPVPVKP